MKNNKIYLIAGAVLLGVIGYFGYKKFFKPESKTPDVPETDLETEAPVIINSKPAFTSNPFRTKQEVTDFQKFVLEVKKDLKVLGNSGADGLWGKATATAWDKYGKEYLTQSGTVVTAPQVSTDILADIKTIINNATGSKAERTYLTSITDKSPAYIKNWANAIRKRMTSGGKQGSTFTFANQVYESFKGDRISDKLLIGKIATATGTAPKLRWNAKKDANVYPVTSGDGLGKISSYFYNANDKMLFVYVPNNGRSSQAKWIWVGSIRTN
jgi:hypothetical protein